LTARGTNPVEVRPRSAATTFAYALLALLLALDLAFVFFHVRLAASSSLWNLEVDNSYPEKSQHLKWLGASLLLVALAVRRRAMIYLAWVAIFFYFLVDDAASIHERWGGRLAAELQLDHIQRIYIARFPGMFLRSQDFGEMTVALIVAAAIAVILVLSWPARNAARERTVTKLLIAWLGLFAFFAVGVDMVHVMAMPVSAPATYMLALVEDGGEMICASLLVGGLAMELARS
jgi:hypothetical protein